METTGMVWGRKGLDAWDSVLHLGGESCSRGMWLPQTKLDNLAIKSIGNGLQQQNLQN